MIALNRFAGARSRESIPLVPLGQPVKVPAL